MHGNIFSAYNIGMQVDAYPWTVKHETYNFDLENGDTPILEGEVLCRGVSFDKFKEIILQGRSVTIINETAYNDFQALCKNLYKEGQ